MNTMKYINSILRFSKIAEVKQTFEPLLRQLFLINCSINLIVLEIKMIYSLPWYLSLIVIILMVGIPTRLTVILLRINDFPNCRRSCTNKAKLTGKTVVVTGKNALFIIFTSDGLLSQEDPAQVNDKV